MALTLNTNCGFVSVAPVDDPNGSTQLLDARHDITYDTSPSDATTITEVGIYVSINSDESPDFWVALYAADGAVVPGEAGTLLFSQSSTLGTGAGWKSVTGLNWTITGSTAYWIMAGVANTTGSTTTDHGTTIGGNRDQVSYVTPLPDPFGGTTYIADASYAIYALYEGGGGAAGTNLQLQIGDSWKTVDAAKINIGDAWKDVAGMQVNIGDSWKTIF